MIKPTKGICVECGEEKWLANKSKKLCVFHNKKRLSEGKKKYKYVRKNTGEKELFEQIWASRPHLDYITGEPLGNDAKVWFFAHVLPKSTYPKFRLNPDNIVLLCFENHQFWDFQRYKIENDEAWQKLYKKEEELKKIYADKYNVL